MLVLEALGPQLEYRNKKLYTSIHSSRHVQVFLMYLGNCKMGRNCFLKGIHISMHLSRIILEFSGSILSANFLYDNEPNCMETRTETAVMHHALKSAVNLTHIQMAGAACDR